MKKLLEGKVALITGAGRGIGREHALMMAEHGASIVVNDLGGDIHGEGGDASPAQEVVAEIEAMGGKAVVNGGNVAKFAEAKAMIDQAIDTYGDIHIVVNNAGILRDRMLFSMTEEDWDAIMAVHLKGTFGPAHHASVHWRAKAKAGEEVYGRIINTASPSGIYGNVGQTNYGAAKAGIAAFTIIASKELARYGATVNAVAPAALTRMTENLGMGQADAMTKEMMSPRWIAPIVTWLASTESADVTGRVFDVTGQALSVAEGWHRGPTEKNPTDDPAQLGDVVRRLVDGARPNANMFGFDEE
jgi:NAD(P)-dependent dehydrogenase (short-subunit alcohol dehydrogenase family)